jgi:hypothetical protein
MGRTSDPETLVIHQKLMPGNNPKNFNQHYDHGVSLRLQKVLLLLNTNHKFASVFITLHSPYRFK